MKRLSLLVMLVFALSNIHAQETRELAIYKPFAIADLKNIEGTAAVNANWKFAVATVNKVSFKSPGPSVTDPLPLYPTGNNVTTNNIFPTVEELDKATWQNAGNLETRRGNGRLSFVWYRTTITLPATIGNQPVDDAVVYFELTADDYSEIYINGTLKKQFGQTGGGVISGYNTRNRLILTQHAKAGESFDIAVLVTNGNIGNEPDNYVWIRNAVLDFYHSKDIAAKTEQVGTVYAVDKSFNSIIAPGTKINKLADGFSFTEGPVWHPDRFLLFSDPNMNMIYRYNPINHNITIYQSHSGYTGTDIGTISQPGSNGLAIDEQGRLVVCQHGNRRVIRHELKGPVTILSDNYQGKKLNSPNDVVLKSDGTVYFTDPPYGLGKFYDDPKKELPHQGVYMIKNGTTILLSTDLGGPNGIAFSPDEKFLYVSNWDIRDIHRTKTICRYEVNEDGTLKNGKVFYSFNYTVGDEALDGLKVDVNGNIFSSAPGGVYVINADGALLGLIEGAERPANMAWGGADGKTLYLTAHTGLYSIQTITGGRIVVKK